jgi:hypothetical protein
MPSSHALAPCPVRALFALAAGCVCVATAIACGGPANNTPAQSPPSGGSVDGAVSAPPDAGPTTTTTLTLPDSGDLQGSKLTESSSQTAEVALDGGAHGAHQADPGRSAKDIQAIIAAHRDEARACYDLALKAHPGLEGDLDIKWTIDPKGLVSDVSFEPARSQITEPQLVTCIGNVIKQIHFNASARGFETRAHYPFNFHPHTRGSGSAYDAGSP